MADRTGRTGANRSPTNFQSRLKCAVDAGILIATHASDSPNSLELDEEDSVIELSSDSASCGSVGESSTRLTDLAASFRVLSESMLRMEEAEMEMAKAREALRIEAERRRVESEAELTQMLLQTQFQLASFVRSRSRKRKRIEEDESLTPER